MPTTSAYEQVAATLQSIISTTFAAEGVTPLRDNLHEALGQDRPECGIAPVEDRVPERNGLVQETAIEIKYYDLWTQEISPTTVVDPSAITNKAERLRRAIETHNQDPGTGVAWYFNIRRTRYPNDPTGNKTRFVMEIEAFGNNAGIVETTG